MRSIFPRHWLSAIVRTLLVLVATTLMRPMANATEAQGLPQEKRVEYWKEDLHVYATELPAKHIDFRKIILGKEFARQVAELQSEVPALTDQQIVLRLMRLTAGLGVAHTRVYLPEQLISFHRIPLILRWYADGLWVLAAADGLGQTLGTRVVMFGMKTALFSDEASGE